MTRMSENLNTHINWFYLLNNRALKSIMSKVKCMYVCIFGCRWISLYLNWNKINFKCKHGTLPMCHTVLESPFSAHYNSFERSLTIYLMVSVNNHWWVEFYWHSAENYAEKNKTKTNLDVAVNHKAHSVPQPLRPPKPTNVRLMLFLFIAPPLKH